MSAGPEIGAGAIGRRGEGRHHSPRRVVLLLRKVGAALGLVGGLGREAELVDRAVVRLPGDLGVAVQAVELGPKRGQPCLRVPTALAATRALSWAWAT